MKETMEAELKQDIRRVELEIKKVAKLASEATDEVTRVMRNGQINALKAEISTMEMVIRKYC